MVTEVRIIELGKARSGATSPSEASGQIFVTDDSMSESHQFEVSGTMSEVDYLTAEDDPVLAALWDNDADAIYDDL